MADQIVDIPEVGQVSFPDGMSDADIALHAGRLHGDAVAARNQQQTLDAGSFTKTLADTGKAIGSGALQSLLGLLPSRSGNQARNTALVNAGTEAIQHPSEILPAFAQGVSDPTIGGNAIGQLLTLGAGVETPRAIAALPSRASLATAAETAQPFLPKKILGTDVPVDPLVQMLRGDSTPAFGKAYRSRYASEVPGSSYREPFAPSASTYGEAPASAHVETDPFKPSTSGFKGGPVPEAPGESVFGGPTSEGLRDQPLYQQMEHVPTAGDFTDTSTRVGEPPPPEVTAAQRLGAQARAPRTAKSGILNYSKKMGTVLNPENVIPTGETPEAVGNYADQMGHRIVNIRPGASDLSVMSPSDLEDLRAVAYAPSEAPSSITPFTQGATGINPEDFSTPRGESTVQPSDIEDRFFRAGATSPDQVDLSTLTKAPKVDRFGRRIFPE